MHSTAVLSSLVLLLLLLLCCCRRIVASFDHCNHHLQLKAGQRFYINSPNYPDPLPVGSSCRFSLKAPADHQLKFNCNLKMHSQSASRCTDAILYFNREGSELLSSSEFFCGSGSVERKSFLNRAVISYLATPIHGRSSQRNPLQRQTTMKTTTITAATTTAATTTAAATTTTTATTTKTTTETTTKSTRKKVKMGEKEKEEGEVEGEEEEDGEEEDGGVDPHAILTPHPTKPTITTKTALESWLAAIRWRNESSSRRHTAAASVDARDARIISGSAALLDAPRDAPPDAPPDVLPDAPPGADSGADSGVEPRVGPDARIVSPDEGVPVSPAQIWRPLTDGPANAVDSAASHGAASGDGSFFSCLVEVVEPPCECGWSATPKVAGKQHEVAVNELPSMAGVLTVKHNKIFCGAAIIHHRYLLSAAHCFIAPETRSPHLIRVLVGEVDLSAVLDSSQQQQQQLTYEIESIVMHEGFVSTSDVVHKDIALLRTRLGLEWSRSVGPACLPFRVAYSGRKPPAPGQRVLAAGWGTTSFGGPQSMRLLKTTLDVVALERCKRQLHTLPASAFCTHTPGTDTCQYDSGGALYARERRLYAVGIISYGFACATHLPAVNTRLAAYLTWIESKTPQVRYCKK